MWASISLWINALAIASVGRVNTDPREAFASCLRRSDTNDTILTPGSAQYNTSRLANINARLTYWPSAIVYPDTPQDVQKYVKCARSFGVAVVGRSGGHSYASYGVGGQNGSLVIDLSNMKAFTINGSAIAKIQTGNRLGEIAQKLWDNGKRALPHGVCPYVGSGGHAVFGGFGPFSRMAGLLHDHIIEAEVVLADGSITTATGYKNSDLFWALRGAGASYGIVTQWTFTTFGAPPSVISYKLDYNTGSLSVAIAKDYMQKWQEIALSAPDELSVICTVGFIGGSLRLQYRGTYYGSKIGFEALSSNWGNVLKPDNFTVEAHNWYDGLVALSGPLSTEQPEPSINFFAKSLFAKSPITSSQWGSLFEYIEKEGLTTSFPWFIEIDRYGGGVARRPSFATAFAHRDALLSFQLFAGISSDPLPATGIPFLNNMLTAIEPNPRAAYVNYVDPTLTPTQWKEQYYAAHYPRLASIKRKYDPKNVFRFPQSIGLSD